MRGTTALMIRVRPVVVAAVGLGVALGSAGCGEEPVAAPAPTTVEDPGRCPLSATQVGRLVRADTVLLREVRGGCEWGVPSDDTVESDDAPPSPDEPFARVVKSDRLVSAEQRAARVKNRRRARDRFGVRDRANDLGREAFQTIEVLRGRAARVKLSFAAAEGGRWVVTVRMPNEEGAPAAQGAVERAVSFFDALP